MKPKTVSGLFCGVGAHKVKRVKKGGLVFNREVETFVVNTNDAFHTEYLSDIRWIHPFDNGRVLVEMLIKGERVDLILEPSQPFRSGGKRKCQISKRLKSGLRLMGT